MEVVTIDVSEVTFLTSEEFQAPTRIEFVGLEHSVITQLILVGNIYEVNVWPKTLRKLILLGEGNLTAPELPENLETLGIYTDGNTIPRLPEKLKHLHAIDKGKKLDLSQAPNLLSLELIKREVSIYDLPKGVASVTCTPEEERLDLSGLSALSILSLKRHKGTILDLVGSRLDQLTLDDCQYQSVKNIPEGLVCLSITSSLIIDGRLNLPEGMISLSIYDSIDGNGNVIPKPKLPVSLQYYNGNSLVKRA